MMTVQEIYQKAVDTFGEVPQLVMTMEETAELTQALSKYLRGKDNQDNIAEEIADVEIMLAQLKYLFDNWDAVDKYKIKKLKRLQDILTSQSKKREYHCFTESTVKSNGYSYKNFEITTDSVGDVQLWFLERYKEAKKFATLLSSGLEEFYRVCQSSDELIRAYLEKHPNYVVDISAIQDETTMLYIETTESEE